MKRAILITLTVGLASCAGAVQYRIVPPTSLESLRLEQGSSYSAEVDARPLVYLNVFEDLRGRKALHLGRGKADVVVIQPPEDYVSHPSWQELNTGDMSLYILRYLAASMDKQGYNVVAADYPMPKSKVQEEAVKAGAQYLLEGDIAHLNMRKKGAGLLGGVTTKGYLYHLETRLRLKLVKVSDNGVAWKKEFEDQQTFHDDVFMGTDRRVVFPKFFSMGMPLMVKALGEEAELRGLLGVPPVPPTPTATPVLVKYETQEPAGTQPTMTPTPGIDPDEPYWANPNTGKKMDPNWKFDPNDGTPRSKFIFVNPAARNTKPDFRRGRGGSSEPTATPVPAPTPES